MSSATIYARVPVATKDAADAYAFGRGLTLTAALQDLLGRGLEAAENEASIEGMQARIAQLEDELREVRLEAREAAAHREQAEQELAGLRQAASLWAERAELEIGSCPSCHQAITGRDVLIAGRCAHCHASTTNLMKPATPELDSNDLTMVLAGAGLLLGLLLVARKAG